jgi:hypothetical protein
LASFRFDPAVALPLRLIIITTIIMSGEQHYPTYDHLPSDKRINACIRQGLQDMLVQTSAGFFLGGLTGLVLIRRSGTGYRRLYTSLGAGVGLGSAWTRTSMNLEQMLASVAPSDEPKSP